MMDFIYSGNRIYSEQEKQDAEDHFIDQIGPVKEDFDKRNITVVVHTDAVGTDTKYTYGSDPNDVIFLVEKIQEYSKTKNTNH
jgi:hypothetical protein